MKRALPLLLVPCVSGCGGVQSAAGRNGTHSLLIGHLFDIFLIVTCVVYAIVLILLATAVIRGRRHRASDSGLQGEPPSAAEGGWRVALTAFAGTTALILFGLTLATWFTDRGLAHAGAKPALEIEVIGHQWWWEVQYKDPDSSRIVRTANELHLPLGRTAQITLKSNDVIHSLWIPNLAGKQDLIPGRETDLALHPNQLGAFRSQCAEFCGLEHAKMALDVTVESTTDFDTWYNAQLKSPPIPTGGPAQAGYFLFQTKQCASCHNVAGTPASGMVAPDLSHVASRRTIAAGALPNTPANMASWIKDPQQPKPGNNMPKVPLSPSELQAVTAYLEQLR